jgi:hypothetical protein
MASERRRLPRQEARWPGRYMTEKPRRWGPCIILDISTLGVSLEVLGDIVGRIRVGGRILVEVHTPAGASITLRVVGEIRNTTAGKEGGTRVGIAFSDLSETEQAILNVLESMEAVW